MAGGVDRSLRTSLRALAVINRRVTRSAWYAAGGLLMAMTAIVLLQVVFRYGLNSSLIWTEEISKTMMVWAAFLVAPWAYRNSANVNIELFVTELPPTLRRVLRLALNLLVIWIVAVFFSESFGMVERGFAIRTASLPIQVGWFFLIIPISFGTMLVVGVELLIRDLLSLLNPDEDFEIPGAGEVMEGE